MFSYIHDISTFVKPLASRLHFSLLLRLVRFGARHSSSSNNISETFPGDPDLDAVVRLYQRMADCAKVVMEVARVRAISVRDFERRRNRLHLPVKIRTFLEKNPGLFDVGIRRKGAASLQYIRFPVRLRNLLEEEQRFMRENERSTVAKLCKLLMMSKQKAVRVEKLNLLKKEIGIPDDYLINIVPRYPEYFKSVDAGIKKWTLELVSWEPEFAKSVIQSRAEEESRLKGIKVRPSYNLTLLPENEWISNWMEMPYMSPYIDSSGFDAESMEMDKWMVGVFHELLSMSIFKGLQINLLASLSLVYGFPKALLNIFRRHSGIFYVSLQIPSKFVLLREAYEGRELIDRDPLVQYRDKFLEVLKKGWEKHKAEKREQIDKADSGARNKK